MTVTGKSDKNRHRQPAGVMPHDPGFIPYAPLEPFLCFFIPVLHLSSISPLYLSGEPFFFWAAWASGNDTLKAEITTLVQIHLLTDFLCSQKHSSKVSFELPEGFSVTAENGSCKVCFGLLPKTLPPGCLSEVGQPVLTCGIFILFLAVYAKQFHSAVQSSAPDTE